MMRQPVIAGCPTPEAVGQRHPVLSAPAHIRGRISYHEAPRIAARAEWIKSLPPGVHYRDLAMALCISHSAASRLIARFIARPQRSTSRTNIRNRGLHWGTIAPAVLRGMTPAQQNALEGRCARTGETMAEALAAFWAEAHA